jgi:hypothetical protein
MSVLYPICEDEEQAWLLYNLQLQTDYGYISYI